MNLNIIVLTTHYFIRAKNAALQRINKSIHQLLPISIKMIILDKIFLAARQVKVQVVARMQTTVM